MDLTTGQLVMLSLFQEYDIKGTLSGKYRIYGHGGVPVDALGYMLQRLGYQGTGEERCNSPEGSPISPYKASAMELKIDEYALARFYHEIDRNHSTNESIKAMFHRVTGIPKNALQ